PDPSTNTYLAFALIIYAVLDGIRNKTELPAPADINLYRADKDTLARFGQLPKDFKTACFLAANSSFIKKYIPDAILNIYCKQ
ncbi:MAG: type I glutamate--ammonia ligase, partial [[Ruminococcus] torques]